MPRVVEIVHFWQTGVIQLQKGLWHILTNHCPAPPGPLFDSSLGSSVSLSLYLRWEQHDAFAPFTLLELNPSMENINHARCQLESAQHPKKNNAFSKSKVVEKHLQERAVAKTLLNLSWQNVLPKLRITIPGLRHGRTEASVGGLVDGSGWGWGWEASWKKWWKMMTDLVLIHLIEDWRILKDIKSET